ncbi:MAG: DUF1284 domain-containing protein [Porphyrobacter sp.]|nr:DUF1284 domain-containing protein [Porphyrobacter sp.]
MTAITARLAGGEEIEIVEGPDDICAPLLDNGDAHCHQTGVADRDIRASEEVGWILERPIRAGSRFGLGRDQMGRLRASFARDEIRSACRGCEWNTLCSSISASGYDGAILT